MGGDCGCSKFLGNWVGHRSVYHRPDKDSVKAFCSKVTMKKGNASGFTLVEVLIAIFILAFALLAMAQTQIMAIRGNAFANKTTTAVTLAQDKIEELKGLSYSSVINGSDSSGVYTRTWTVQNDTPSTDLKTVTVTVSWQDTTSHQVLLETIIST